MTLARPQEGAWAQKLAALPLSQAGIGAAC
jgi:hypothetical protein